MRHGAEEERSGAAKGLFGAVASRQRNEGRALVGRLSRPTEGD